MIYSFKKIIPLVLSLFANLTNLSPVISSSPQPNAKDNHNHDPSSSGQSERDHTKLSSTTLRHLSPNLTTIYFIGDLHADIDCARAWVEKTNLIDITTTPFRWIENNNNNDNNNNDDNNNNSTTPEYSSAIVFLGDYVDKGVTSIQVLEFIRELHQTFPNNILPLLGNHDVYLLFDTLFDHRNGVKSLSYYPMGRPVHDYAYSFLHPHDYVSSGYVETHSDDDEIMKALYEALGLVYTNNNHGKFYLCASEPNTCVQNQANADILSSLSPFDSDKELSTRAKERLSLWREKFAQGLFDSKLIHWLSSLPLVAVVGDAVALHGGLSGQVLNYVLYYAQESSSNGVAGDGKELNANDALHQLTNIPFQTFWNEHLQNMTHARSLNHHFPSHSSGNPIPVLDIIYDIVNYRGYFDDEFKAKISVDNTLKVLNSKDTADVSNKLNRVVVGHTPHQYAFERFDGTLLASDSSLSRFFRAYGNMYCPIPNFKHRNSRSEFFWKGAGCEKELYVFKCDGSISVIKRESATSEWPKHAQHIRMSEKSSHDNSYGNSEL